MELTYPLKLVVSGIILTTYWIIIPMVETSIIAVKDRLGLPLKQFTTVMNFFKLTTIAFVIFGLILLWGVELQDVAFYISGICGMVAIGFIATWSVLSNITAGLILFFISPFHAGDTICVKTDEITAEVLEIGLMFLILKEPDDSIIYLPNNIIFQKVVRKLKKDER